jgi:hypothetical protein
MDLPFSYDENFDVEYIIDPEEGYVYSEYSKPDSEHVKLVKDMKSNPECFPSIKIILGSGKRGDKFGHLNTNVQIYQIHRELLMKNSDFFKTRFDYSNRNYIDATSDYGDLDINPEIFLLIFNFIYEGYLVVKDVETASFLLAAAIKYQFNYIIKCCYSYLTLNLSVENCLFIYFYSENLIDLVKSFIYSNCDDVFQNEEILNLNQKQFFELVCDEKIELSCESIFFKVIVDWISKDVMNRRQYIKYLFSLVRYQYMPIQFLEEQHYNCALLKLEEGEEMATKIKHMIFKYPLNFPFGIYIVGGHHKYQSHLGGSSLKNVECLKVQTDSWEKLICSPMELQRTGLVCVSHAFYIYAIGGISSDSGMMESEFDYLSSVECYDPVLNRWLSCESMSRPRYRAAGAVLNGLIFVCGGSNGRDYHSSVEYYKPLTNKWHPIKPMAKSCHGLACVVVKNILYAIGGRDSETCFNDVECYDPRNKTWERLAPMQTARSAFGCVAVNNCIYVVGGCKDQINLFDVERFDVSTGQWSKSTNLSSRRSSLACVAWNNCIYAIGGYNGEEFIRKIEKLDLNVQSSQWNQIKQLRHPHGISGHGAVISIERFI